MPMLSSMSVSTPPCTWRTRARRRSAWPARRTWWPRRFCPRSRATWLRSDLSFRRVGGCADRTRSPGRKRSRGEQMSDEARKLALQLLEEAEESLARAAERNVVHVPAPDWRGKTVARMSSAEFGEWLDQGKPPLAAADEKERRRQAKDRMSEGIAICAQ